MKLISLLNRDINSNVINVFEQSDSGNQYNIFLDNINAVNE